METVLHYFAWFDFAILCAIGGLVVCSLFTGEAR